MDGTKDENATYADVTMLGVLILAVQVCTKRVSVAAALKRFFPKKIRFRFYTTVCVPGTWYICTCYTYTSTRIYMYEYPCIYLCSIGGAKKNASTTSTSIYLVHTKCTINSGNAVKRLTKSCLSYVTRKCFVRASCNPPCSGKGCTSRHKPHTRTQRRRAVQNLSVVLLLLLLL